MSIQENLLKIQQEIHQVCKCANRECSSVKLLAVSKTKPMEDIFSAYKAGQVAFGENYVQEGIEKITYFQQQNINLEWHFIGPLQSNKTRLVAEYFDWIQTLDREKIAFRLNEQRPINQLPLNVLIQINISDETTKSGIQPNEMLAFAEYIQNLPQLKLRGLMVIPAPLKDRLEQQNIFLKVNKLFTDLQKHYPNEQIDTLSMGMSDDMDLAINAGSTMVRIGTAIFGKRN
ncbi:hypothetical protein EV697_10341 [Bisgaardia hudsonensis]|uniref:Pyridoxal phosphate homeostasis protein n=1 Tax=Bisgaardia hudsonensis TaxID=109472 RepID=A0A4R2N037_9PAST|nr:YggS family pyridoxal phosphate-dependent enzyme [Bisgaardia hudsonensis]QLB13336.1 YggS family pyridoxal phosphate enzyme [Bisgaardia hudsonensis]TCP12737.1 hypothetical protein EV697_10341 [Bisgaardia hudsonensis]